MEIPLGVYIPSYKRSDSARTHKLLNYYKYVVRETEEEAYKKAGYENIFAVKDEYICGMCEVNQWIIDNAQEEIIVILDDDIGKFYYRLQSNEEINDPDIITAELERIAQLMLDLDIGFCSTDPTITVWNYDSEFSFKGTAGAVRWINRNVFKSKFNKDVVYNCDLDVVLNELLVNRIILKPKYFCSKGITDLNSGGFSDKQRKDQVASINLMKAKWGRYFDYNFKSNKPYIYVER